MRSKIFSRSWLAASLATAVVLGDTLTAQVAQSGALTLQAAIDRALAANPAIAAARLRGQSTRRSRGGQRTIESRSHGRDEKEAPKQSFGFALPLELGGKREKRIAVSQATSGPATPNWRQRRADSK